MTLQKLLYKITWVVLVYFLVLTTYNIFYSDENIFIYWDNMSKIKQQQQSNTKQFETNRALYSEVLDLKNGFAAIEERARNDLGLIKKDEVYYQIID